MGMSQLVKILIVESRAVGKMGDEEIANGGSGGDELRT